MDVFGLNVEQARKIPPDCPLYFLNSLSKLLRTNLSEDLELNKIFKTPVDQPAPQAEVGQSSSSNCSREQKPESSPSQSSASTES